MSDIKPKLSVRSGVSVAEKSPSPSTKLMLNHGKPNFTINRSKSKTDSQCPFSPSNPEAASVVLKSTTNTTPNGYIRPTLMKIPLSAENEVSKVVLRRTKLPEENGKPIQQDEEPEFVKAQRKIAERLANQNSLDFESRKSGYFTHVMISPSSPTRQMELPVVADHKIEKASVVEVVNESVEHVEEAKKPIETPNEPIEIKEEASKHEEAAKQEEAANTERKNEADIEKPTENGHDNGNSSQLNGQAEEEKPTEVLEVAKAMVEELVQNATKEVPVTAEEVSKPVQNGHENGAEHCIENVVHNGNEKALSNGDSNGHSNGDCNGDSNGNSNGDSNGDSQPKENDPVPKSEINFEPKTVTSFAKELSSEPNKYPDTVKTVTEIQPTVQDELMQDMYKLKFDIHADSEDVKVIPTVRATE